MHVCVCVFGLSFFLGGIAEFPRFHSQFYVLCTLGETRQRHHKMDRAQHAFHKRKAMLVVV